MSSQPVNVSSLTVGDRILARAGAKDAYTARLTKEAAAIRAAQKLRFEVFNLEMNEGLPQSYATGLDADLFDEICDHLVVEERATGAVVGTYRMQTGPTAAARRGYYSAQEFDFTPFEAHRAEIIELGRACVHKDHRNLAVLSLLWRGIAAYAKERQSRYLVGCSSLTSQNPLDGSTMYAELSRKHLAPAAWRTKPLPHLECPMDRLAEHAPKVPKLLGAYLSIGARICGPPAIDREFKTIDFLTLLDIGSLPMQIIRRYLS